MTCKNSDLVYVGICSTCKEENIGEYKSKENKGSGLGSKKEMENLKRKRKWRQFNDVRLK